MNLAPIVLFAYNRPKHTLKTLESLSQNYLANESELFIYIDAPKDDATLDEIKQNAQVIKISNQKLWCNKVNVIVRKTNFGLANSVIDGITNVIDKYGKIIVLEDDLLTSKYFLTYCNEGLEMYKNVENIYSINAYQFPIEFGEIRTFLNPLATSSWGWATWKKKWDCFDNSISYKDIIQKNNFIKARFNFAGYDYATMLNNNNSWAIRWYYSVFVRNGLGVFPTKSLIENIGFDGSGVHQDNSNSSSKIFQEKIPLHFQSVIDLNYYLKLLEYFSPTNIQKKEELNIYNRLKLKIKSFKF